MSPLNGTPQDRRYRALGGKKITPPSDGGKGRSGCAPALLTIAVLGSGWLSMILTGSGWTS